MDPVKNNGPINRYIALAHERSPKMSICYNVSAEGDARCLRRVPGLEI